MRKIITLLILLITLNLAFAQIPVGPKYDLNGIPFNGYFDPLIYSPDKSIITIHNSNSYEIGYYYDSTGIKKQGLIKFENDKILFKETYEDIRQKIRPGEINHLVIGVDSFLVIDHFYFNNRIKEKPEFVQYITEFNGYTFVKHYHFSSVLAQQFVVDEPIIETYLVKAKDSLIWYNFPDNIKFKKRALKYFSHIPYLKEKISSGKYQSKDMLSIIKMAKYYEKYKKGELIYYDKYWQEIRNAENAEYSAKILQKEDTIWTFEYYNKSEKIYKAHYSSFYPNTKNGDFTCYYPNGKIRQVTSYLNNKAQEVKVFSPEEILLAHYQFTEHEYPSRIALGISYLNVCDSLGNNILKKGEKSGIVKYDKLNDFSYTSVYKNNEILSSYRLWETDTIFQITDPDYKYSIKKLQDAFTYYMDNKNYDKALSVNAQGTILVSFFIDKKGNVLESTILNTIHPQIDALVRGFINSNLLEGAAYRFKLKRYKKDKIKRYYDVVIPFEFSINRFYRQPASYYNNNIFWHHHMMHQQMMNYTPPKLPSGF